MKKITVILLTLLLTGCTGSPSLSPPGESGTDFSVPSPTEAGVVIPSVNPPMPLPEYPVIDGSSSTVTMHMAIRTHLTDARFSLTHSQTYAALERLIPGHEDPADVVLAVKYYDDTLQDAKDRGADLVITPVAKEGFIFLVHKDNPVDNLTQQQIRDIYSGRITNWKEVGGKNRTITPYTRNWASGSQTAMEDFMGGVPIEAKEETPLFSMSMVIESVYTNPDGIGYNIYSWTMEQGESNVKTVAVDGVKLSHDTLLDDSYPLTIYTYSYYNKGNDKGKTLTDWLLTAEGQKVVAGAGYAGLYGELPYDAGVDYYEDERKAHEVLSAYYAINKEVIHSDWWSEQTYDMRMIEKYSDGKSKAVTVMFLVHYDWFDAEREEKTRFIVLTREKGGEFEVVNEGEWP